ncbi:MAG: nickel pincer cofactor biosynthesis protein LarC [Nitrospirota bacterium]
MKIAYFDCFSGISGDMCLGALVDAGLSMQKLEKEIRRIPVRGYRLASKRVRRAHVAATKVDVTPLKSHLNPARGFRDICKIVRASTLSPEVKQRGLLVFERLFRAEAKVHGTSFQRVHLHELSAVDCIIDIFGTVIGLELLGIERIFSSPLNLGGGFVTTEHGTLPVPPPATAEILKNTPLYSSSGAHYEMTTPTGAALIKELADEFGEIPLMETRTIGIGAGSKNPNGWPNILRVFVGELVAPSSAEKKSGPADETVTVIETNIDDMNPQVFAYVMDRLLLAGALDVFLTQVLMKKGRPGVKLSVLCKKERRNDLTAIILKETTTIGVRFYEAGRITLSRTMKTLETEYGRVRVKFSSLGKDIVKAVPEYEDCKKIAKKRGIPLLQIMKKFS